MQRLRPFLPWLTVSAPMLLMLAVVYFIHGSEAEIFIAFKIHRLENPTLKTALDFITDWTNLAFYAWFLWMLIRAWRSGDTATKRFVLIYIAVQVIISLVAVRFLKMAIGRPRPGEDPFPQTYSSRPSYHSMPSGHTTEATASVLALAGRNKSMLMHLGFGLLLALLGFSRMYLGWHHPSDVLCGWLLGSVAGFAVTFLAPKTTEQSEEEAAPRNRSNELSLREKAMNALHTLWNRMLNHPLLALLAVVALQTQFALNSRSLWFSDEVRYANAYENMERMGAWVVLALNGVPYPDKPPLYFWLLSLLDKVTALDPPAVFYLGSALTGLGFLYATYFLGRSLRMDTTRCLAGSLIVSTAIFFAAILHYSRMDLMFAALIVASMGCLARSFVHGEGGKWTVLGLALTGVAVLVKGPLGVLFPLFALIIWAAWRGEWKKLFSLPVLLGIFAAAGVASCWVGAAFVVEGYEFVRGVFVEQIFKRATNTFHHKEGPFYYFAVLPAVWLPWTFFAAGLPLAKLGSKQFWKELFVRRKSMSAMRSWLWVMLLSAFTLLSLLSGKVVIYLLPVFAPLALLTADALPDMDRRSRARSWTGMAAFLALFSAALPLANSFTQWPHDMDGLPLLAVILMTVACTLYMLRHTFRAALLALTIGITIWIIPATLITAPSLDPVMSTRQTGEMIGKYMEQGYVAAAYDTYSGIFTYYAGNDLIEIPKHFQHLNKLCAENPKVIIVMKKKHLKKWTERPDGLKIVNEQYITDQPYILLEWISPGA